MSSKSMHIAANGNILFLLWLGSISLCVCVCVCVCVCMCVCVMHHIFFIQSSFDGYLGYFYILAIANNAAVNIGMNVSF